jgi:uncharacterized protein YbjT (DUF2867 family)
MIAVLGATGTIGRAVVQALRAAGMRVRAVVRDPKRARAVLGTGVTAVRADLDRPETLAPALRGAAKAFFVSAVDERYPARVAAFLAAARAAGVEHVVKLGAMEADLASPSAILRQHAETDALVRSSGLAWTLLQPNGFYQNLLWSAASIRGAGKIHGSLGRARQALVDVRDVAAVAALVLTRRSHAGRTHELTGPEALTPAEVAGVFARVLEIPVTYVDVAPAAARERLRASGLPGWNADEIARLYSVFATGVAGRTTDTVPRLLRRKAKPLEAWVREHAAAFRPPPRPPAAVPRARRQ